MSTTTKLSENEEVLYFGCLGCPGHFLHQKDGRHEQESKNPWGVFLDGGLLRGHKINTDTTPTGEVVEVHKMGWTAISFWDRSGDSRPASCSSFIIHADVSGEELIEMAKQQWPKVFTRAKFPTLKIPRSVEDAISKLVEKHKDKIKELE